MDECVRLAVIILVKKISSLCHVWIFLTLLYKIICMESILVDINDDDEIAKLVAVVLYDEKSSLRGYLRITDRELVTAIVAHYARGVSFKDIVLEGEPGLKGIILKRRVALLEARAIVEMRRLKMELRCVLGELLGKCE